MFRRLSALLVLVALVIVPTIMRSRQRVDLRETTRLSIRLNWQSDAPPQRGAVAPDTQDIARAAGTFLQTPPSPVVAPAPTDPGAPLPYRPLDNAPDRFRGPPSVLA